MFSGQNIFFTLGAILSFIIYVLFKYTMVTIAFINPRYTDVNKKRLSQL